MADIYSAYPRFLNAPACAAVAVTPDDSNDLAQVSRGLYVGVTGDVVVILADDTVAVTFKAVPVGILPVRAKRVKATNTTATNILALS